MESVIRLISNEEIQDLVGIDNYEYAIYLVFYFSLILYDDDDGKLESFWKNVKREREDVITSLREEITLLEIDTTVERIKAELIILEIVNNFSIQWYENYLNYNFYDCIEEVGKSKILYLMVMSALHEGTGLWEELGNEKGSYKGNIGYINMRNVILRISESLKK